PGVVPELEAAWSQRAPSWVRADLVEALGRQSSVRYIGDFLQLAGAEDETLSEASIRFLGSLADPAAIPRLQSIVLTGTSWERTSSPPFWTSSEKRRPTTARRSGWRRSRACGSWTIPRRPRASASLNGKRATMESFQKPSSSSQRT